MEKYIKYIIYPNKTLIYHNFDNVYSPSFKLYVICRAVGLRLILDNFSQEGVIDTIYRDILKKVIFMVIEKLEISKHHIYTILAINNPSNESLITKANNERNLILHQTILRCLERELIKIDPSYISRYRPYFFIRKPFTREFDAWYEKKTDV